MASYAWQGNVLTIAFSKDEDGKDHAHTLDVSMLTNEVREAALRFGIQTVLRNATAGKMDDIDVAIKAQNQRLQTLMLGKWTEAKAKADVAGLTEEEQNDIVARVVCDAYAARPGAPSRTVILEKFNASTEEQQGAVLAALKPQIDKALKAALAARKKASKATTALPEMN